MQTIFEYLDYRKFLRDYYEAKRAEGKVSLRSFSLRAGITSPNYLKLVMDGDRNLSAESVRKFVKALGLKRDEGEFFTNLVFMNQAEEHEEKNYYYTKLSRIPRYLKVRQVEKDQYEYFSKWYYAAIRELTVLPQFRPSPEWIGKALRPEIPAAEARAALEFLLRLGLVVKAEDGRLHPSDRNITGGNEVAFLAACNFHAQMLKRAAEYVVRSKAKHREFSALTLSLSDEKFELAKQRIQEFRRELHALLADCEEPNAIYQVTLSLFPLAEAPMKPPATPKKR